MMIVFRRGTVGGYGRCSFTNRNIFVSTFRLKEYFILNSLLVIFMDYVLLNSGSGEEIIFFGVDPIKFLRI